MPVNDNARRVVDAHPDAGQLAEYVDGVLPAAERAELERHLASCEDCRTVLAGTFDVLGDEPAKGKAVDTTAIRSFRRRRVIGVAALLAAAASVFLVVRLSRTSRAATELQELVAAVAAEPTRPLDGRLAGFPYRPAPPVSRGASGRDVSAEVSIAAAAVEAAARERPTPRTPVALAVAYAVAGDLSGAIREFERACPNAVAADRCYSDLSATYLRRGRVDRRADDFNRALDAANRALAINDTLPEACFNLGLSLEAIAQTGAAREQWRRCLMIETDDAWKTEIRDHLQTAAP